MTKAAVELAHNLGLEDIANVKTGLGSMPDAPRAPRSAPAPAVKKPKSDEGWSAVSHVPEFAPPATFWHTARNNDQHQDPIDHIAEYRIDGHLYLYVVRFLDSKGLKVTLPYCWCISAKDGCSKWVWRHHEEPRPLYFPGAVSPRADGGDTKRTVILVEGEKKAGVLQALLDAIAPGIYIVASWCGGSNAWKKADWSWLNGTLVLLWPDCDAKREPLTAKERNSIPDATGRELAESMKPLLPVDRQPGMAAMLGIGALLRDSQGCTVHMLPIPEPLAVVDGWDCADAINIDGWDGARVLDLFGKAQPLQGVAGEKTKSTAADKADPEKKRSPVSTGGEDAALAGDDGDRFQGHLNYLCDQLKCHPWDLGVNRKMIIAALRKAPGLNDCLGLNELTGAPSTKVAWPWRDAPAPLAETDDLRLGDYLCSTYKIKAASRASLAEAIEVVADERRFHPIRDWLQDLKHDGKARIDDWLIFVLGKEKEDLPPKLRKYLQLVGRYLLMGLVARVMEPGCKFDYSPVFEGLPGRGKSTFVKALVGLEYFSDTHFELGQGKDGMEQLEGRWGYELSELTALRKADGEQVKQFFSSTTDRFRGAYGKFVQSHPRQCVIFCSTNKKQYLYDLTGNRRFWPIWIDQFIKLDWLKERRDQLFAEAFALFMAGERYTPTHEDEELYFVPEQKKRLVETAVQSRMYELLTREGSIGGEGKSTAEININTNFVTLDRLVSALGADAAKSSSLLEAQIRGWLEAQGWTYGREGGGMRRRGFKQPAVWPPAIDEEEDGVSPAAGSPPNTDGSPAQGPDHKEADDAPF